jgi:hypothetical protein
MTDLASRLANRVQLTTDGHKAYLTTVDKAFGKEIDYAMLVKIYGENSEGQKRYSPAECGAPESHDAYAYAPLHPPNKWLQQKNREPRRVPRDSLHTLQLCLHPPDATGYSGDGGGPDRSGVVG